MSTVTKKKMGRGRRPVETVPDHGINIGADVTKLWLITNRNNNNTNIEEKENFNFLELKFDIDLH